MISNNYFTENKDLLLQFEELTDWKEIALACEGKDFSDAKKFKKSGNNNFALAPNNAEEARSFYKATLESMGELVGNEIAPKAQEMEAIGLKLENGQVIFPEDYIRQFNAFNDAGLVPYSIGREFGGLNLPASVSVMYQEILSRANLSFYMMIGLLNLGKQIEYFGSENQKNIYLTKMAAGDYMGAMALTEPDYGSDLQNIMTRAEKMEDGTYKINGVKQFLSQACGLGDRPCIILTLARTGKPGSGGRGVSLFIVKSTDVEIAKLEHKMGIKCSPTCQVVFNDTPAEIIGKEGFGLVKYAMSMMNDARLSVGSLGVGLATASYYEAKKYASERKQFGKMIMEIPAVRRLLDGMEREITAMRLLVGEAARSVDLHVHEIQRNNENGNKNEEVKRWEKLAALFTPMAKYYCSENGVRCCYDGIQVHGGVGYSEEYDVARIYRDARILTIYEGTTQLQVVAAIGGVISGMAPNGFLRGYFESEMGKISPSEKFKELYRILENAVRIYKAGKPDLKDIYSFEVVDIATRTLCSLLYERAVLRASAASQKAMQEKNAIYNIENLAICKGHLYRLEQFLQ